VIAELRTPAQMVRDGIGRWPGLDILTFVEVSADGRLTEERRTYKTLLANGEAIAGALAAEGMARPDATFAIMMQNHPEFVEAMIGSELAGTVFVPVDPRTRGDKLAYMLRFARCRGVLVADYALAHVLAVVGEVPELEWIWVLGKAAGSAGRARVSSLRQVMDRHPAPPAPAPDLGRTMQLLYTSGTTGDPKAIVSPYARFAAIAALGPALGLRDGDRPYTGLSLTHANAQLVTLGNALAHGLPLVISRRFTKSRLWEILARHDCTMFSLLGGMAISIYAEPPGPWDRDHRVRYVLSAGMPPNLWPAFAERFEVEIFEFFGAAEGGMTLNPPRGGPIGSIGKPPPDSLCTVRDEADAECPPGVLGEICFRPVSGEPPPVTYLDNPAASAAKVRDGWFRSGDAGYKDADGWLYFAHRLGGSIRRNGDFISAAQIEAEIAALDQVADVHVYGLATPANAPGEKEIVAAVVLHTGAVLDARSIVEHCRHRIGASSVPSFIQLVDEIPKTASEKPQQRFLERMLAEGRGALFDTTGSVVTQNPAGDPK
jgi:crotonobetaine/carnitine-CoA ligase